MAEIKSSGTTREFSTGSHRDMSTGKGRMDLLPAESVLKVYEVSTSCENDASTTAIDFLEEALKAALHYMKGDKDKDYLSIAARAALIATGMLESTTGDADGNSVKNPSNMQGYLAFGLKQTSLHYEGGAVKYGENNWKLGQPMSVLLDSGMRHTAKAMAEIEDEPHCRAAAWNFLCAIWTEANLPEMQNIKERG